jgi:hypothetical protein
MINEQVTSKKVKSRVKNFICGPPFQTVEVQNWALEQYLRLEEAHLRTKAQSDGFSLISLRLFIVSGEPLGVL